MRLSFVLAATGYVGLFVGAQVNALPSCERLRDARILKLREDQTAQLPSPSQALERSGGELVNGELAGPVGKAKVGGGESGRSEPRRAAANAPG